MTYGSALVATLALVANRPAKHLSYIATSELRAVRLLA